MVGSKSLELHIVHLYGTEMNIYGDRGNVLALQYRAVQRGINVRVAVCGVGDKLASDVDIVVAGGGQDSGQAQVQADFTEKAVDLKAMFDDGVSCLAVCGMYQLLGHEFTTLNSGILEGIGYLDVTTRAQADRLVGSILVKTDFGELVGFENHGGNTYLLNSQAPLGRVIRGYGNNNESVYEGARLHNVYGTYLHGPVLPKNPAFTDLILRNALDRKYGSSKIMDEYLDDSLERAAFKVARQRP